MITLYGVYRSRATRPLWALAEIGVDFRHVPVIQAYRLKDARASDAPLNTASAAFLAVSPIGQIPVMQDDDLILTESMAISLYLARRYGDDLAPRSDAEAALRVNWSLFGATGIEYPALEVHFALSADTADTPEGQANIAVNGEKLRRPFAQLQRALDGQDYLIANRFSPADINVAECVRYAQGHTTLLAEFPAVKAWLERCQARPAFQKIWAARSAEPA